MHEIEEIHWRKYFVFLVKCLSLWTDQNQTSIVAHAQRVVGVELQKVPWNRRESGESTFLFK